MDARFVGSIVAEPFLGARIEVRERILWPIDW